MNTTRKIVILGMCLVLACGTSFAQETNPAKKFSLLKGPEPKEEWAPYRYSELFLYG